MEIIKFESLENKLIQYDSDLVLVDKDVAELYGVSTKEINQAVSNNPDKFPNRYILELSKKDKNKLVKNFDRFKNLKYSTVNPKVFIEKGLYLLATVLKGTVATQTTIKIIGTFTNIRKLSRNLNSIDEHQTKEESNTLLEKIIDIEPTVKLQDDETEVETKIELNLGFMKVSRVIQTKNFKEDK